MKGFAKVTTTLAVAGTLVIGLAGSALASGKGGATKSTLKLIVLTEPTLTESTTPAEPHHGDVITFEISTSADQPFVNVRCHQGQDFVYDFWAGYYVGAWGDGTFTLTSTNWTSSGADCTARLVMWTSNGRERTLASMSFQVLP